MEQSKDKITVINQVDISIVVPVYNEESCIIPFIKRIEIVMGNIGLKYELIFAKDPSTDQTKDLILNEIERNERIRLITFSRRYGQPAATFAGIRNCSGKYCVVIDVDLQDPPEIIEKLYQKALKGYDVVYAKRRSREKGEIFIKSIISKFGYWLINKLSDVNIPRDTGDFRIMTRRVIDQLKRLNETHGFLRGMVAYVGFRQTFVEYDREDRLSGKGNYNRLTGSFKIGLNGLIGFSTRPLLMMTIVGFILAGFSFLLGSWYVFQKLMGIPLTAGLSTIVLVVTFFAGIQLLSLGIIGEYVGRIYEEVKGRPMYIIDQKVNFHD